MVYPPRFFDNDLTKVPRMALTVGVATVLEAREVVVVVTGQRKSLALSKAIEEGVNHLVCTDIFSSSFQVNNARNNARRRLALFSFIPGL
jgi:6-phosphogluconolactonase/glucosamine-6-phosphate isomerase/deaminase